MSIIVEPWYFVNEVDNLPVAPTTGVYGTTVTPGTTNADGATATLLSALAFDVHYIVVGFSGYNLGGAAFYCLADIMLDAAGGTAWRNFIDDLVCGFTQSLAGGVTYTLWYHFPVYIKAGTSVGCRARTSHSTTVGSLPLVTIYAYGNPSRPDAWWCGSGVETLGVTAASSIGTSVTPGNSGAFGSWATLGTSTARYGAIQYAGNGIDNDTATAAYFFQVGYNNKQIPGAPTMATSANVSEFARPTYFYGPYWCDIPSGTAVQVRGTASGTAEIWAGGFAAYGVY